MKALMNQFVIDGVDYSGVLIGMEVVTPETANAWLKKVGPGQRGQVSSAIGRYARDVSRGVFRLQESVIAFDNDGWLINGQQRLNGCVKANRQIVAFVARGVPSLCSRSWDKGSVRTVLQSLMVAGYVEIPSSVASMLSTAKFGIRDVERSRIGLTTEDSIEFIDTHREALSWTASLFTSKSRGVSRAQVRAVVFRASYHIERRILERFVEVLKGVPCDPSESAAASLARMLLQAKRDDDRIGIYGAVQNAVHAFTRGEPRQFIRAVTDREFYNLPEERSEA